MRSTAFDSTQGSMLDRFIWKQRVAKVRGQLGKNVVGCIADLGCGKRAPLLQLLLDSGVAQTGVGVDLAPDHSVGNSRLRMVKADLNKALPLEDACVDVALSLAVLEHLEDPVLHLREIRRILKPEGRLLLTTPSPRGKPVLEFLAYRVGVIDRAEIEDHKTYFDTGTLGAALDAAGFRRQQAQLGTFQFGMNNIALVVR